jgi:uncharacterized membrane protein
MGYGMGLGGGWDGGWSGLLSGIGMMLLVAGIVILVVWIVIRALEPPQATTLPAAVGPTAPPPVARVQPDALELLRVRFAKGEITEAEFATAKRVLGYE